MFLYRELIDAKLLQINAAGRVVHRAKVIDTDGDKELTKSLSAGLNAADVEALGEAAAASSSGSDDDKNAVPETTRETEQSAGGGGGAAGGEGKKRPVATMQKAGMQEAGEKVGRRRRSLEVAALPVSPPGTPQSKLQKAGKAKVAAAFKGSVPKGSPTRGGPAKLAEIGRLASEIAIGEIGDGRIQISTTLGPGLSPIPVTAEPDIDTHKVLNCAQFRQWAGQVSTDPGMTIHSIHIQSIDMFGPKVGFVKFRTVRPPPPPSTRTHTQAHRLRASACSLFMAGRCDGALPR